MILSIQKISILSFCSLFLMGSFVFAENQVKAQEDRQQRRVPQTEEFAKRREAQKEEIEKRREAQKEEIEKRRGAQKEDFKKRKENQKAGLAHRRQGALSDEQKVKFDQQKQAFRKAIEGLREESYRIQKELDQALDSEEFDAEKIKTLHQKRQAVQNQIREQKDKHHAQMQEMFGSDKRIEMQKDHLEKKDNSQHKGKKDKKDKKEIRGKKKD